MAESVQIRGVSCDVHRPGLLPIFARQPCEQGGAVTFQSAFSPSAARVVGALARAATPTAAVRNFRRLSRAQGVWFSFIRWILDELTGSRHHANAGWCLGSEPFRVEALARMQGRLGECFRLIPKPSLYSVNQEAAWWGGRLEAIGLKVAIPSALKWSSSNVTTVRSCSFATPACNPSPRFEV